MRNPPQKSQFNIQYKRTVTERAYYRRESSMKVAKLLETAAVAANDDVAYVLSQRINKCADPSNHFIATDLNNQEGECFDGFGNIYSCGSKLCHTCMAKASSRNRRIAREVLENTKLVRGKYFCYIKQKEVSEQEQYRFITLTMPQVNLSLIETLNLLKRSWELFRKLDFTKNYFNGFVKSPEFTIREDTSYHAHLHLLAISFFIPEHLIKQYWFNCVKTAFLEEGIEFKANNIVVNLKKIDSMENSLLEVCKYVTKSESLLEIPAAHLLEIANVNRFPRMFELTGRFKIIARRIREKKEIEREINNAENTDVNYLDTKCITDGEAALNKSKDLAPCWRKLIRQIGADAYLEQLDMQIEAVYSARKRILIEKYPMASFTDLSGYTWYEPDIEFIEGFSETQFISMQILAAQNQSASDGRLVVS